MRVIFLDIDGVLNSIKWNQEHKEQIQNGILVDEAKVPLLKELADQTGAILVLHSGWRIWFNESLIPMRKESQILCQMFSRYGMMSY